MFVLVFVKGAYKVVCERMNLGKAEGKKEKTQKKKKKKSTKCRTNEKGRGRFSSSLLLFYLLIAH